MPPRAQEERKGGITVTVRFAEADGVGRGGHWRVKGGVKSEGGPLSRQNAVRNAKPADGHRKWKTAELHYG